MRDRKPREKMEVRRKDKGMSEMKTHSLDRLGAVRSQDHSLLFGGEWMSEVERSIESSIGIRQKNSSPLLFFFLSSLLFPAM